MHAIEEAKGCMQKGKDFNRLQAKGDTIFRGEIIFGEKPFLERSPFWGEAIFGEKPFWGEAIKKIPCPRDPPSKPTVHWCLVKYVMNSLKRNLV